jgi:two-component system nitrogen regulation sensor histidine kinase GlnL
MEPAPDPQLLPDYKSEAFDQLTSAVVVIDGLQVVRAMNQAAEDLFGVSEQRVVGTYLKDHLYDDGSEGFDELLSLFSTLQPITRRAALIRLREGQRIKADLTISHNPLSGVTLIELQPINRLLRINREDQVLASRRTVQALIRGLSHEIKNPLGGLRGAAQLLERELDDPGLKEYTAVIIQEADRLKDLVDRMLGPNQRPNLTPVNIHQVLEHVVRLVDAEFPGRLRFERDYDPSVPELEAADEDRLIQAMLNIVRNAAQMLEEHEVPDPTIWLRTRVVRSFTIGNVLHRLVAQIDVTDNGPGIEEEMLERIFFPMITSRAEGSGLGLAITQNIIGQHEGVIECESEPGETCFSVFLPLELPANE